MPPKQIEDDPIHRAWVFAVSAISWRLSEVLGGWQPSYIRAAAEIAAAGARFDLEMEDA
jgi:hypothetical protein